MYLPVFDHLVDLQSCCFSKCSYYTSIVSRNSRTVRYDIFIDIRGVHYFMAGRNPQLIVEYYPTVLFMDIL